MRNRTDARMLPAVLLAVFLFSSCAGGTVPKNSPEDTARAIAASQTGMPSLETITDASPDFEETASRVYGLDPDTLEEAVISYAGGTEAEEIIVLRCTSENAARDAAEVLEAYASGREAVFTGYAPAQAARVADREVVQEGTVVMLIIVPDPQAALAALDGDAPPAAASAAAESAPQPTSEATQTAAVKETYDHDAVLEAVTTGDMRGLGEANRQVAELVSAAISSEIQPSMTDYEKEKAVHDWIVKHVEYDPAAMEHPLTLKDPIENHENPIGALIGGGAICYGYSSTFQLFMDALGIPCITVDGAAYNEDEAHSWNLVELDGQWYYVDVTWDDPVGGFGLPSYKYFNVPAETLEANGPHIWDTAGLPQTAAEPYAAA